jgi:hypothetical protein
VQAAPRGVTPARSGIGSSFPWEGIAGEKAGPQAGVIYVAGFSLAWAE